MPVFSEGHRLLGQIEPLDLRPVQFRPGRVSREADQSLIDIDAANARAAAERRVKYLDRRAAFAVSRLLGTNESAHELAVYGRGHGIHIDALPLRNVRASSML